MTTETTKPRTILSLAKELVDAFEQKGPRTGDKEKYWSLKEGSPEWMRDVIREAHDHGDILPDDWRYAFVQDAASCLAETEGDEEEARERLQEYVYTSDITAWLGSSVMRPGYCDEWLKDAEDTVRALMAGMHSEQEEVLAQLTQALKELADTEE